MSNNQTLWNLIEEYLTDDHLSGNEKAELRDNLTGTQATDIAFLRNRLFELARQRVSTNTDTAMSVLKWLERCVKVLDTELISQQAHCSAHFSPGNSCKEEILKCIRSTKSTLDICVFTISDDDIAGAIVAANNKGVEVRVITDNHKSEDLGSDIDYLIKQGVTVRVDRTDAHMHHKFCISDNQVLLNGSFNWTRSATTRNEENIILSEDKELLREFARQFEYLWNKFK